jgi:hypothetical protein
VRESPAASLGRRGKEGREAREVPKEGRRSPFVDSSRVLFSFFFLQKRKRNTKPNFSLATGFVHSAGTVIEEHDHI